VPTALLAGAVVCAALLAAVLPHAGRRIQEHRADQARSAAAEHRRRQLIHATDWAITAAIRKCWEHTVDDWRAPRIMLVSVADVVRRAEDDFNLHVSREEAHALLMDRLTVRGHLQTTLVTDDHDQQEGTI
jgi:type II secretory pathway pseudopilin PulG